MKMRKWAYIAQQLAAHGAPKQVVHAAECIDETLVRLGLGYSTPKWTKWVPKDDPMSIGELVLDSDFCTACYETSRNKTAALFCGNCRLGDFEYCTPRSKYPVNWFRAVISYLRPDHDFIPTQEYSEEKGGI